ncbi:FCD domain-containing protein [Prosthecodimorpha staleyi]|uniref:Pyruvate dehydrogenase complex repressor n=1 Tax=Prosthecodimorpha staleyi TaxID=2840188 RepID=A0A947D4E0_9HYPH|nr:FCD domain-containing protein [Prosthecodimorpha staleyi]MBT9289361.1 FCD domain-containing protein [Prosthecodimorpha staleyi]
MVFEKISHNRTADAVAEQIELLILQGILRPGDRLPGERDLSAQVDVSRPILREALKTLEDRHLLVSRHGEGTFVADVIGAVFSEPVVDLIRRYPEAVADYLEFRRAIEGWSASLAAARATDADRQILTRVIEDMQAAHATGIAEEEAALDLEFHTAVGEAAHNIVLLHTLRSCYRLLADGVFYHRSRLYGRDAARTQLMTQHLAIHAAILAGDPDRARRAAEAHIDYVEATTREVERIDTRAHSAALRLELLDSRRLRASRPIARPD